jgi:hypothetical protein
MNWHGKVEPPDGWMVTAFRAFVKSLVFDNPFVSRNYIETLNQAPTGRAKTAAGSRLGR